MNYKQYTIFGSLFRDIFRMKIGNFFGNFGSLQKKWCCFKGFSLHVLKLNLLLQSNLVVTNMLGTAKSQLCVFVITKNFVINVIVIGEFHCILLMALLFDGMINNKFDESGSPLGSVQSSFVCLPSQRVTTEEKVDGFR